MHTVRPWLAIGSLRESRDRALLDACGVGAMLQLADHAPQPGIETLFLPIDDGVPLSDALLDRGVAFVRAQKALGRTALVACGLGISRSATVAIAALKEDESLSLFDALAAVRAAHPEARPHPALWQSLCRRYTEDVPYVEVIRRVTP